MDLSVIVACDDNGGIGYNNDIPWKIKADLMYFQKLTKDTIVVMGRKTWDSIGSKPLKNRINIVITSQDRLLSQNKPDKCMFYSSLKEALQGVSDAHVKVYIIGGSRLYTEALTLPECKTVYVTHVKLHEGIDGSSCSNKYKCDTYFPLGFLSDHFQLNSTSEWLQENEWLYKFSVYKSKLT